MGLDMYLIGEKYLFTQYDKESHKPIPEHREKITEMTPELKDHPDSKNEYKNAGQIDTMRRTLIYWRKSNEIHKWFVDTVQDGVDDCGRHRVDLSDLENLLSVCKEVVATKNTELLPRQEGFFFGSTEYDEDYYKGLEYTIKRLEFVLSKDESGKYIFGAWDLFYASSW